MIRNLFTAALLAALCAGLVMVALQHFRITPLILHAETFEAGHSHAEGTPTHDHATTAPPEWAPQDGIERTLYTSGATLLAAAGFAFVIGAVSMLFNVPITFATGALWAMAGFVSFSLAPAFGLPPELPGLPAADLGARQLWWVATVLMTGGAFLLLAKTRAAWAFAVALLLVLAPHLVGAPVAPDDPSAVPAHLATAFAAVTLGTAAVFWTVLGLSFGRISDWLLSRSVVLGALGARA